MEPISDRDRTIHLISLGDGVELCGVSASDAAELFAAIDRNRARLRQWLPWVSPEYGLPEAVRFVEECVRGNDDRTALTRLIRSGGEIRGAIGLHRIDPLNRASSIGYWLDAASEGRGIVTRACRAIVTEGFRDFGLHRIEIRCATGNQKSCAIPRRLGFVEEGVLREAEWLYDHWVDLRVFSMLDTDWHKVTGTSTGL
jgi:ribosomal-protein-serine acetyltransferase